MMEGWGVFEIDDGVHVAPINDRRRHVMSVWCWCGPIEDGDLIVHSSLDGREFYERGARKPS